MPAAPIPLSGGPDLTDLRVELLITPTCPHAAQAEAVLREVLSEAADGRRPPGVDRVYISDLDHAAGLGFRGSPTIRLDGRDIAPVDDLEINLGCRVYRQPDGRLGGVPPGDVIREAIQRREEELAAERLAPGPLTSVRSVPARAMRGVFLWSSRRRSLGRLATKLPVTRGLVRRFVAGYGLDDALVALERLRESGLRWTVDVLGESVDSEEEARAAADRYIETLDALAARGLEGNVSLKLTQMGLDVDQAFCRENVRRIVARAAQTDAFVRVDMEDHTRADATLAIARALHEGYAEVGVVIQSYLRRAADDVEQLIGERIRVRLCKGAYDEPTSVAFASKAEVDDSYRRLTERLLLEGRYPALATHDESLIEHARWFADQQGIGPERFEFQMLYGIRRDLQERLVADGYTVRVYVPYGDEWYPYFMRRLAERPANAIFVLRNLFR